MPKVTRMKNRPPEKIYLQWFDPIDFSESEEVTWCKDQIEKTDPEYIRKDLYNELKQAMRDTLLEIGRGRKGHGYSGEVYTQSFNKKQMDDLWERFFEDKE